MTEHTEAIRRLTLERPADAEAILGRIAELIAERDAAIARGDGYMALVDSAQIDAQNARAKAFEEAANQAEVYACHRDTTQPAVARGARDIAHWIRRHAAKETGER